MLLSSLSLRRHATVLSLIGSLLASACGEAAPATTAPPATSTVAVTGASPTPTTIDKVSLRLSFSLARGGGQWAPLFLGIEQGFYRDQRIDLTIGEGKGSAATAQTLAAGQDDFGFTTVDSLAVGIPQGFQIKMIMMTVQKNGNGLAYFPDSGIKSPKDFEGKTVAQFPGGAINVQTKLFFAENGVDQSKITFRSIESSVANPAFLARQIDVLPATFNGDFVGLRAQKPEIQMMVFADHGLPLLNTGIAARLETIEKNPDLVRRFVAATVRSHEYATTHVAEAAAATKKHFPQYDSEPVWRESWRLSIPLLQTDATKGKPLGYSAPSDWESTFQTLLKGGLIKEVPADLAKYYTNEFVPGQ